MRIDFLGLEAFAAIAERGSFNLAAAHLNLSQTALSHRIRKLELDLGSKLLSRTGREVVLTQAGVDLLPTVKTTLQKLSESLNAMRKVGNERQEHIAIGCLPTLATSYLPRAIAAFRIHHPDVRLQIQDMASDHINQLLELGAIAFGVNLVGTPRWDFDVELLTKDTFCLVCREDHRLAALDSVNWSDLVGEPLVRVGQQTGNRMILDDALGNRRETLTWLYEVQHLYTAVTLVRLGFAATVIPRLSLEGIDCQHLRVVALKNPSAARRIGILTKRGRPFHPLEDKLRQIIKSVLADAGTGR